VATIFQLDGFEHGKAAAGAAGIYGGISGTPAIVTSPVRTGLRALEVSAAGASDGVQYSGIASTFVSVAFYLRFATLPGATVKIMRLLNASGNGYMRCNASGQLSIIVGTGSAVNVGSALSTNTWYRIVAELDTSTGTASFRASVDGGTDATATNAQATANTTAVQLGPDDAVTVTFYADDWLIATADGDYEEIKGWASHSVQSLIASADGTHSITTAGNFDSFTTFAFSNSTVDGYSFINHRPLQLANTADNVIRQDVIAASDYMELTLENLSAGDSTVEDVRAYTAVVYSSTTGTPAAEVRLLLSDNTEVLTTGSISVKDATEDPGTTLTAYKRMTIAPAGGWDTTKVNGLKFRIGFDNLAADANFIDLMVEVLLYTSGAATQTLDGVLFSKAPTFFTGKVNLNLAGTLFSKAPTFFTGTISLAGGAQTLNGVLFTKAPSFFVGKINMSLAGILFSKAPTFFIGKVNRSVIGVLFSKSPTFFVGKVNRTVIGVLFSRAPTFFSGAISITGGPQTLTGVLFTKAPTFAVGKVNRTVIGVLFVKAPTFPQGQLRTTQILSGVLFTKAGTFYVGLITAGVLGKPVSDPQARDLALAGGAVSSGTQGEAVLASGSGDAILTPVDG